MANTTNNNNNNNNATKMTKEERMAKSAEFQAARLSKATERMTESKNYVAKATGVVSEGLRHAKADRIAGMTIDGLATACVGRAKEIVKGKYVADSIMRYLKKDVAEAVKTLIGEDKLALFVDCSRGEYKIDAAIKYACSVSRNEMMKSLLKDLKKSAK